VDGSGLWKYTETWSTGAQDLLIFSGDATFTPRAEPAGSDADGDWRIGNIRRRNRHG